MASRVLVGSYLFEAIAALTDIIIREQHYEHSPAVCDGGAWICVAVSQCTGPTEFPPTTTIKPRPDKRSPALIGNTITAATTRRRGCYANPPAHTPITGTIKRIHKLHAQLRYAGHELPGYLRSGDRLGGSKSHGPSGCY